jgi:arylsulfatase A-like enzyme
MWGNVMLFAEAARTPLLVRVPSVTQPGRISTGIVELVDIFPTLAQLCGVTPPAHLQGRSFVPLLESAAAPGKNHAYTVVRRGQELGRAVRFDRWRYTEWATPGQNELYDLTADPNEWTNLAPRPEHAALVRRASQLLAERRAAAEQQRLAAK